MMRHSHLGPWTGTDDVPASQAPPAGLAPERVPLFVGLGFDDNAHPGLPGSGTRGGMSWATDLFGARTNADGTPALASFYLTSEYATPEGSPYPTLVQRAWFDALQRGHELGDHTHAHPHGAELSETEWTVEIQRCLDVLAGFGAGAGVQGFRAPFLEYNDATFTAIARLGFRYDCSIEDGYQEDHDGTNFHWPYTLDRGSPGNQGVRSHPGLWELPVHPVIVPPDQACARYGVAPGLRARLAATQGYFDPANGKITGADYNLWVEFRMTKAEFVATLCHTLDLRLAGNRAPMMLVGHADIYSDQEHSVPNATLAERQEAVQEFVDHALARPEVRVVSLAQILEWVRNPQPA